MDIIHNGTLYFSETIFIFVNFEVFEFNKLLYCKDYK